MAGTGYFNEKGGYGVYTPVSPEDAPSASAIASTESNPLNSELLSRFIKEIRFFSWKTSSTPKGMPLNQDYQAERMNPVHRFGSSKQEIEKAEALVVQFLATTRDKADSTNFARWLRQQKTADSEAVISLLESWKKVNPAQLEKQPNMVNYLDMAARQQYVIEMGVDGLLYCRVGDPVGFKFKQALFDTAMSTAAFGGRQKKAIWVQGPSGRFYSSTKSTCGKFHHSSFLAGRDVKAAGDWEVDNGKLKTISATSGHYRPPLEALWGAVADLNASSKQILGWGAVVEVKPNPVPAREFLEKGRDKSYLKQLSPVI